MILMENFYDLLYRANRSQEKENIGKNFEEMFY